MDDLDRILACCNPPDLTAVEALTSNERVLAIFRSAATAFPDATIELAWTVATAERVVVAGWICGTHLGPWRGVPATGRTISALVMLGFLVEDGRILDVNLVTDSLSIAEQLGAVEALAPPACRLLDP